MTSAKVPAIDLIEAEPTPRTTKAAQNTNPFDPANLRFDPSASETFGVKKLLTTVPVGKPSKQEFFRTHPDLAQGAVMNNEAGDVQVPVSAKDAAPAYGNITATFSKSHMAVRWEDRQTMPFDEFVELLAHPAVGQKQGSCYTPATFSGLSRHMDKAVKIDMAVLDSDSGQTMDEIADAVEGLGWLCVIHSTFNHLQTHTTVAAGPWEKWQAENPKKSVADYLVTKKGFLTRIARDASVVNETNDGAIRSVVIKHQPCPKFRVILPLNRPWVAEDFPSGQYSANAVWRERITALAHAVGLNHDQSCVDTSRLFYMPRKSSQDAVFEFRILQGTRCPIFELPDAPAPVADAPLLNLPAAAPRLQEVKQGHTTAVSDGGEFVDLTSWAAEYSRRFQVVDAITARTPRILAPNHRGGAKHHILCPTAGDHITGGEDWHGTFAVNAGDMPRAGLPLIQSGFYVHCSHAGCAGHDRLDFVRAMLADGTLDVADLTDERFLLPAEPDIDISGILNQGPEKRVGISPATVTRRAVLPTLKVRAAMAKEEAGSNIPPALYTALPGIMGSIHEYIVATAVKPQPALALASILTFMGAAIGRKAEVEGMGTRANIYALVLGHSGSGKERLLSSLKEIATAAGLFDTLIGVEEVASDSGIINAVIKYPNQVCLIDEIGFLFSATSNMKAGNHIQQVNGALLKLYSSSRVRYKSKSYADTQMVKTVDQPCVSILGCSTPRSLFGALSSKDVHNGLLSRFVMFNAGDNDPLGRKPEQRKPPQDVVDWAIAWNDRPLNENPLATLGFELIIDPLKVRMTAEAEAITQAFEVEMHGKKIDAREDGTDALYVRARENALKFALVRACSAKAIVGEDKKNVIDQSTLLIDANIMLWACELSRVTITGMEAGANGQIADSEFERELNAVSTFIRARKARGATEAEIRRAPCGKKWNIDKLLKHLVTSGEIALIRNVNAGKPGHPRNSYVHKDFLEAIADQAAS